MCSPYIDGTNINQACLPDCTFDEGWYCNTTLDDDGYVTRIDCEVLCGDGYIRGHEECEDGGSPPENHDGCNVDCTYEDGWDFDQTTGEYTEICGDEFIVGDE